MYYNADLHIYAHTYHLLKNTLYRSHYLLLLPLLFLLVEHLHFFKCYYKFQELKNIYIDSKNFDNIFMLRSLSYYSKKNAYTMIFCSPQVCIFIVITIVMLYLKLSFLIELKIFTKMADVSDRINFLKFFFWLHHLGEQMIC